MSADIDLIREGIEADSGYPTDPALDALDRLVARLEAAERDRDEAVKAARGEGWDMASEEELREVAAMLDQALTREGECEAERDAARLQADAAEKALREIQAVAASAWKNMYPDSDGWYELFGDIAGIAEASLAAVPADQEAAPLYEPTAEEWYDAQEAAP